MVPCSSALAQELGRKASSVFTHPSPSLRFTRRCLQPQGSSPVPVHLQISGESLNEAEYFVSGCGVTEVPTNCPAPNSSDQCYLVSLTIARGGMF